MTVEARRSARHDTRRSRARSSFGGEIASNVELAMESGGRARLCSGGRCGWLYALLVGLGGRTRWRAYTQGSLSSFILLRAVVSRWLCAFQGVFYGNDDVWAPLPGWCGKAGLLLTRLVDGIKSICYL